MQNDHYITAKLSIIILLPFNTTTTILKNRFRAAHENTKLFFKVECQIV